MTIHQGVYMSESRYLGSVFAKAHAIYCKGWTGDPHDDAGSADALQAVINAAREGELESDGFFWCALCNSDTPYVIQQRPFEHASCLVCGSELYPDSLYPI
jgi:hypothetical protein